MSRRQLVKRAQELLSDPYLGFAVKQLILDMAQEIEWLDQNNQVLHQKIDELKK